MKEDINFEESMQELEKMQNNTFAYFVVDNLKYLVKNLSNYTTIRQVLKNEFNMSNRLITKLKQNKSIYLNNEETKLNGDYIVNKLTIPLTYNGTMNLTVTKAAENIL